MKAWGARNIMAVSATGFIVFLGTDNDERAVVGSGLALNEALSAIGVERATLGTDGG